ncbi:hypothetical protein, partial [Lentzea indica]|uniref:hypothetical protein n=1 Tax=Lentzea indica TaxID=2604800 RepID=UPI001CB72B6E
TDTTLPEPWGSAPDPANLIKDLSSAARGLMARRLLLAACCCVGGAVGDGTTPPALCVKDGLLCFAFAVGSPSASRLGCGFCKYRQLVIESPLPTTNSRLLPQACWC